MSFTANNVRSYRDEVEVPLLSTRLANQEVVRTVEWAADGRTIGVLPAIGLFGANGSGKSTLLAAMTDMRRIVLGSFRSGTSSSKIPRRHFRLDAESANRPSTFAVDLVLGGGRSQYSIEFDDHSVQSEYAFHFPKGRQALVFHRTEKGIDFGAPWRAEDRSLQQLLRSNALLLSAAGAVRQSPLRSLFEWFERNLQLAEASTRPLRAARTADLAQDPVQRERVLALIRAADLGITDVALESPDPEMLERLTQVLPILLGRAAEPDEGFEVADTVRLTHQGRDVDVAFDAADESLGTMVWIGLVGPVLDALDGGHVLLADELDASLHPKLVGQLIALFQDPTTNRRRAQLIFNAHDVTVLGDSSPFAFGCDETWFTEKGNDGATKLYGLDSYSPRKEDPIERRYLQGRYGAIPILDDTAFRQATELVSQ